MEIRYLEFLIWPLTPTVLMFYHVDFFLGQFKKDKFVAFFYSSLFFVSYLSVRESFKIKEKCVFFLDGGK